MDALARFLGTWILAGVLGGIALLAAGQPLLGLIALIIGAVGVVAEIAARPRVRRAVGEWRVRNRPRPMETLQTEVVRAPANPALPEVSFETQGRTKHGVPLKGKPRTLLFAKPVQRVVREEDLPVILSWGVGKSIEVLRFYEGGVTLSEVNTIGDVVVFTPYYERPPEPVELDTATRTGQLTADAVVAPAKDSATSVAAARTPVAGSVGPAVHHQVAAVGRNITCVCGWTGSTAVEFEAHKSRPLQA